MSLMVHSFYKDFNTKAQELRSRIHNLRCIKQKGKASKYRTTITDSLASLTECISSSSNKERLHAWRQESKNTSGC